MIDFKWVKLREELDKMIEKNFSELLDGYYGNIWNRHDKLGNDIMTVIRKHMEGE